MYYIFVILFFPVFARAADINDCAQLHGDEKTLCLATTMLNVYECDKIQNLTLKISCVNKVRDGQRQVNSFHPSKK